MAESDMSDLSDDLVEDAPSAAELEAAGQNSMFGDAPAAEAQPDSVSPAPADPAQPYRVLARKYRPQTFAQLIGQDAMVRTLGNAIARDRLAHAFLMTGVRGVGKTSTARLIAKALNCIGPNGEGGATIDPCGRCEPCVAIAEGRHIDVIEMDAASHTGVDDVREIIEAVRYAAVSARYKIYIIDEVHMLSRNAFNALLKTLEEPPAHVKFIFATTEVDKLPVTVLSRTQRFDLRRIPTPLLQQHFGHVCREENVEAEDEALAMIARAAEGSVRDGLSILDQAIAHADLEADGEDGGRVDAARVRDMLGLADKGAQRRLLGAVLEGEPVALLDAIEGQYALGVEPLALMRALLDLVNRITVAQIGRTEADAPTEDERQALTSFADRLSAGQLHRIWQLLLRGYDEVRHAPDPLAAAQMALLRMMHAADMPDPGMLAKRLEEMAANAPTPSAERGAVASSGPSAVAWPALVEKVEAGGNHLAASLMRLQIRVVELGADRLIFSRPKGFTEPVLPVLRDALLSATGVRWEVEEVPEGGALTLVEAEQAAQADAEAKLKSHPLVKAALQAFPQAEWVDETDGPATGPWAKSA